MSNTYLDEIVEYPAKVVSLLANDALILKLLNNGVVEVGSEAADDVIENKMHDYGYVSDTTTEVAAHICIEPEFSFISDKLTRASLYVSIYCHKNFMKLDPTIFPGLLGNRRDNLTRYIDKLLNGSDIFGIGRLVLTNVNAISSSTEYTARELKYDIPDFSRVSIASTDENG